MIENDEIKRVMLGLKKTHRSEALTLAGALHYVAVHMPIEPASTTAMVQISTAMGSRARELGFDPKEIAEAFAAVNNASRTMAILSSLPE